MTIFTGDGHKLMADRARARVATVQPFHNDPIAQGPAEAMP